MGFGDVEGERKVWFILELAIDRRAGAYLASRSQFIFLSCCGFPIGNEFSLVGNGGTFRRP